MKQSLLYTLVMISTAVASGEREYQARKRPRRMRQAEPEERILMALEEISVDEEYYTEDAYESNFRRQGPVSARKPILGPRKGERWKAAPQEYRNPRKEYEKDLGRKAPTGTTARNHTKLALVPRKPVTFVQTLVTKKYASDALLTIPRDFLLDTFNTLDLPSIINGNSTDNLYQQALDVLTSEEPVPDNISPRVQQAAEQLYVLVHKRYALSLRGLDVIHRSLRKRPLFGRCPRVACQGTYLLPFTPGLRYCASCATSWRHWESKSLDAWGCSLVPFFCLLHGTSVLQPNETVVDDKMRLFGFRLHADAY